MRYFSLKKVLLITILLLSFCISIGYSALNKSLSISGDLVYRVPTNIRITGVKMNSVTNGGLEQYSSKYTKNTISLGLKLPNLNSTVVYEATIKNNSSSPKVVSAITNKVAGNASISYTYDYKINTVIAANSTTKILFTFKYNSGITSLPSNQIKECTISLTFEDAKFPLYDKIQELSANSSNYINKYTGDTSTFTGNKSVYYYYGKAENNNALFANYCWKIVRTTDTGGVKLLYNGVPSNGTCNNTGDASQLTAEQMNTETNTTPYTTPPTSDSSLADVGYMYNTRYESKMEFMSYTSTYVFGKGFNWITSGSNANKYTLSNTYTITSWASSYKNTKDYHYTTFTSSNTYSPTINFVYYTEAGEFTISEYIQLSGGKNITTAINEMLFNSEVNKYNSTIKGVVDYWYSKNMTSYTPYLEDTVWCNDRTLKNLSESGWNPSGSTQTSIHFSNYNGYNDAPIYSLKCSNKVDRLTTNTSNGSGSLTYPVGLLTASEADEAIEKVGYTEYHSPLASGKNYWTMTPTYFYLETPYIAYVTDDGSLYTYNAGNSIGVRPAVSLKPGSTYSSGDGAATSPYIIYTS